MEKYSMQVQKNIHLVSLSNNQETTKNNVNQIPTVYKRNKEIVKYKVK